MMWLYLRSLATITILSQHQTEHSWDSRPLDLRLNIRLILVMYEVLIIVLGEDTVHLF
jgi:hypothetical protein